MHTPESVPNNGHSTLVLLENGKAGGVFREGDVGAEACSGEEPLRVAAGGSAGEVKRAACGHLGVRLGIGG